MVTSDGEYLSSRSGSSPIAATVLGMLATVWLAARVYRVGILMYGKRASFREVFRWIRAA